jgi:hypothetical protein
MNRKCFRQQSIEADALGYSLHRIADLQVGWVYSPTIFSDSGPTPQIGHV